MLAQPDGKGSKPVGLLDEPDTELEKHHLKLMKSLPQPAARYTRLPSQYRIEDPDPVGSREFLASLDPDRVCFAGSNFDSICIIIFKSILDYLPHPQPWHNNLKF